MDAADKEGFTPLHMAAGYLHNDVCTALLAGGADISKKDRQGRDISALLESLREKMSSASAIKQRMRLEEVSKAVTYFSYEDVAPAAVLALRKVEGQKQYLVQWRDDFEDSWVAEEFMSAEVCLSGTAAAHMLVSPPMGASALLQGPRSRHDAAGRHSHHRTTLVPHNTRLRSTHAGAVSVPTSFHVHTALTMCALRRCHGCSLCCSDARSRFTMSTVLYT